MTTEMLRQYLSTALRDEEESGAIDSVQCSVVWWITSLNEPIWVEYFTRWSTKIYRKEQRTVQKMVDDGY
jgi:hypothetical protein